MPVIRFLRRTPLGAVSERVGLALLLTVVVPKIAAWQILALSAAYGLMLGTVWFVAALSLWQYLRYLLHSRKALFHADEQTAAAYLRGERMIRRFAVNGWAALHLLVQYSAWQGPWRR